MNHSAKPTSTLAHFPVALFSSVMGLAALTVAWFKAHQFGALPLEIGMTLRWATSGLYLLLLLLFGAKLSGIPPRSGRIWSTRSSSTSFRRCRSG